VKAPERVETPRLVLRRPRVADADAVYERYASDEDVSRYLAWHRHTSPDVTRRFLQWSDTEWERWPAGPYLIEKKDSGELIGGTGYAFETRYRASTGYVLAKDAWRKWISRSRSASSGCTRCATPSIGVLPACSKSAASTTKAC
jgi:ribosomal-protein-alanine N-acetyltransferase